MKRALIAALTALALAGCQVNLTKDVVTDKWHTNASAYTAANTQAEADRCTLAGGRFIIRPGAKNGQCETPERWTVQHGKKGGPVQAADVTHRVYDAYKVGDEWTGS